MYRNVLLFAALLLGSALAAQLDSLGQWRSLQSFNAGRYVAEGKDDIIYTTGNAVFFLDKEDLSFRRLTRPDGLAEGRIVLVKYHAPTETLLIVYENSTIDLLRDGMFRTLREIDNFNFSGDKRIYDVSFGEDNTAYLAAGYGVSALSLDERLFMFTTFTGTRVNSVAAFDDHLFAGTDEGVYRVPRRGVNLNDFGNWTLMGPEAGLPGDYSTRSLESWRGKLYMAVGRDIFRLDAAGATVDTFYAAPPAANRLEYLSGGPTRLLAGYRCTDSGCGDRRVIALEEDGGARQLPDCAFRTNFAIEDDRGRIFFGDDAERVRYLTAIEGGECVRNSYPGPENDDVFRLLHDSEDLWVAPGQLNENAGPVVDGSGVFRYSDGQWVSYNRQTTSAFRGADGRSFTDDDVLTIIDVDYDPVNDVHYFSSFFEGLVAINGEGEFTLFDETNSPLEFAEGAGAGRVRIAGTATDEAGFTYVAVSRAENDNLLAIRNPEGQWSATGGGLDGCDINLAFDIAVDDAGFVWILHRGSANGGITVLDLNGTPMDPSDDRCRTITPSNSNLPTNQVRSIAVDLSGEVWIGTTEGVVTFTCADPLSAQDCRGQRRGAEAADGFGDFLLANEEVRAIAVDGANRKWIGTNGGAFLLSERGDEQLLRFDKGNSPLPADIVRAIAIDPNTGTVYFGTDLGILSYRSDATAAPKNRFRELTVFPNPVEPGYTGRIAIEGLARDARVKITDMGGKLVEEGIANGGTFTWAGTDYNGRRVTSGVYLVYASSGGGAFDNSDPVAAVGKIVFLR